MTEIERKILNYIIQIDRMFCANDIADITGVSSRTVRKYLQIFRESGRITQVKGVKIPKYYYYNHYYHKKKVKSVDMRRANTLKKIWAVLTSHKGVSCAKIAEIVKLDKHNVNLYLRALYWEGAIWQSEKTFKYYAKVKECPIIKPLPHYPKRYK